MRTVALLVFWLAGLCTLAGQGYYIKAYDVDLRLADDASLEVTERIKVYFDEQRRGIIRAIPYEGASVMPKGGEVALRTEYGDRYAIHLQDIQVEGHPFTVYNEGSYQYIRIGDPDVYLTGDESYTIRYTVYGAVQEFSDHAELPWNVIGDEWDTRIENASFTLNYPGSQRMSDEDFLAVTGYRGSSEHALSLQKQPGSITGRTLSTLRPGQGLSIALRLPKSLFRTLDIPAALITRNYVIESLHTQLALQSNGATRVTERITINALNGASRFLRILSLPPGKDADGKTVYAFIKDLSVRIQDLAQDQYRVSLYPSREQTMLEITPTKAFEGTYEIRLDYTMWGAATSTGTGILLRWNVLTTFAPEPVEHYIVALSLPEGYEANGDVQLPYPRQVSDQLAAVRKSDRGYEIESRKRVLAGKALNINMGITGDMAILSNLPQQAYVKEYWIEHLDQALTVKKDGSVAVNGKYQTRFRYREGTASFHLNVPLGVRREREGWPFFKGLNILGRKDRYYYRFTDLGKLETGVVDHPYQRLQIAPDIPAEEADVLSVSYTVKGILQKKGPGASIRYPVWIPVGEPLRGAAITIAFEKPQDTAMVIGNIVTEAGKIVEELHYNGTAWEAYIPDERYSDQPLYVALNFPKSAVPGYRIFASLGLFWLNNKALVLSLLVFLFLLVLWRLIGKDTPGTIIARFKPPEDMPPAEAGFIWDGKLHDKDMTSLIYYWGAQGYLKIRELPGGKKAKPDFEFVKCADLPDGAREYEKIFFGGLFATGNEVLMSSLKNTFYTTYHKARKAFVRFERKAGYYARGTRGLGKLLIFLGWPVAFITLGLLIYSAFVSDYSYSIPALIVAVSLIIFGRIMPRMKGWAQEALDKLSGFREFIRTAESERLKALIDEDPKYFGLTLPYAVVMGEGKHWAEKFEDILIEPPDWYEGYDRPFTPWYFTHHMIHSMHDMRSTFTSTPTSSSSSWSGGSSFGGGFSSGGGFGGGGGGSW